MKNSLFRAAMAACIVSSLAACGGDSISNPTSEAPIPVAQATPAPAATPTPAPQTAPGEENPGYLIEFENNAGFKVTNKTTIGQEYRAYITSFDNQELELAFKVSGTVPPDESWGGSFNATCVQLDITQHGVAGLPLKGGAAFFDKNGKQFNPSRSPEKVTECRTTPCKEEWVPVEYEDAGLTASANDGGWGQCSATPTAEALTQVACSQSRRVRNTCTGEVKTETKSCECSCEQSNPNPGAVNGSGSKTVTKHNGSPEVAYWYWDMDNGQGNTPKQQACEGRGGVWLGDDYNIPNDGTNQTYDDVCRVTTGPAFPGGPGADVDFIKKVVVSAATADKYSVSVSASYSVGAGSGGNYTFQIVYVPTNFVKKEATKSLSCGESFQGSLTWGPGNQHNSSPNYDAGDGHVTGAYKLRVLRNGANPVEFALP